MTLHVMRGVSGSGKTTFTETLDAVRVSRDEIRRELTGDPGKFAGDNKFESQVTKLEQDRVRELLIRRNDVVIDDTNLIDRFARNWLDMAYDYGHDYQVHVMRGYYDTFVTRNANRPEHEQVPESVIASQYAKFEKMRDIEPEHPFVDWTPVEYDPTLPEIVTFDIDGTLALCPAEFSVYDPKHYPHDELNTPVACTLDALESAVHAFNRYGFSGRSEDHRKATEEWLGDHFIGFNGLFMRKSGDKRRDDVVKVELFNENIRGKFNVLMHFDDRDRVVDALRSIGLTVFQVAPGDF